MEHRIPNSLRVYRKQVELTQQEVARILGLGKRGDDSVIRWEKGDSFPSFINLIKLSILYNVTPEELYAELFTTLHNEFKKKLKSKKSGT